MKKILLATVGVLGVIGITAGVLLTHKAVPQKSGETEGQVQGTTTQDSSDSQINSKSLPGDFQDDYSVTITNDTPTQTMEDAPTYPSSDEDLKQSLENMALELNSVTPSINDVNEIQ